MTHNEAYTGDHVRTEQEEREEAARLELPLKTDVVPYNQYRKQRLDGIRNDVGLAGRLLGI